MFVFCIRMQTKRGKSPIQIVIWTTYFHLFYEWVSACVRVRARGIQSIIDWISLHTWERVYVHALKHPRKCNVYTIWNVDNFVYPFYEHFLPPPVNQTVHELDAHTACVCVYAVCIYAMYVWVSFVTQMHSLGVFFPFCLLACLFVCLVCSVGCFI